MILVFMAICIASYCQYRKVVLFTASSLMFLPQLGSGIAGVKLFFAVAIIQIALFYMEGFYKRRTESYPLWLLIPGVTTAIGYILSNQFGVIKNLPIIIVNCLCYFYYPYIIWHLIDSEQRLKYYLKSLLTFFVCVSVYALIEFIIGHNIVAEVFIHFGIAEGIMGGEDAHERFGLLRCNSFLPYSSSLGMVCSLVFFVLLNMKVLNIKIHRQKENFLLLMLPFCVLLSGTRSQFCVFAICVVPFLLRKDFLKTKVAKTLIVIAGLILLIFNRFFYVIIDSILHSDNAEMGSTSQLRVTQFEICYSYFIESPIWGFGKNYIWEYIKPEHDLLFGAESSWFPTMVDYGLVGCMNYLFVVIGTIMVLKKYNKFLILLPIAFLFGETISIVIAVEQNFLLIMAIVLIKMYKYSTLFPNTIISSSRTKYEDSRHYNHA